MINRILKLPKDHSFFLFGPRQTGKSTHLHKSFEDTPLLYYDLLKTEDYLRFWENPALLREEIFQRDPKIQHVIIDEVQRVPDLLNEVHFILESANPPIICMSGSSARKLKRSHANLLGGRAWTFYLHPLTHLELKQTFLLERALQYGTLPSVYLERNDLARARTLKSYVETYLEKEIQQEAQIRNLRGFMQFLTFAADENGHILNYSSIARLIGIHYLTVKEYFQILQDTLLGFMLFPFSRSTRKRLTKHPKFYFFDPGVQRAILKKTLAPIQPKTSEYGQAFEHWLILEIMRMAQYHERDYRLSFYHDSSGLEVDLIIETPMDEIFAIEIKAFRDPRSHDVRSLRAFKEVVPNAKLFLACLAPRPRKLDEITILPWHEIFKVLKIE